MTMAGPQISPASGDLSVDVGAGGVAEGVAPAVVFGAVRIEGKTEFSPFSSNLIHHAHAEEEILFPAAILIGEYLRLKL